MSDRVLCALCVSLCIGISSEVLYVLSFFHIDSIDSYGSAIYYRLFNHLLFLYPVTSCISTCACSHSFRLSLLSHHRYICRCHNIHLICYIAVLARVCVGPRSMNVAWGSVRYEDLIFVYIIFRRSYLIHSISFVHGIFRESESSMAFVFIPTLCVYPLSHPIVRPWDIPYHPESPLAFIPPYSAHLLSAALWEPLDRC